MWKVLEKGFKITGLSDGGRTNTTGIYKRHQPVPERRRVDLDETGAVDEHLGPHVTHRDQLGSVFQTSVVLLQNLHKHKNPDGYQVSR